MFTGIVESTGTVVQVRDREQVRDVELEVPEALSNGLIPGASVSVDGACLTAVRTEGGILSVEVIGTTLSRTVAGRYADGSVVNLERALPLGGRLEGHLVQGHVDGLGELLRTDPSGEHHLLTFRIPTEVHRLTIPHGSIALNGVSLTVNRLLSDDRVEVGIIPLTWERTNLHLLRPGDPVNVEGDLIGKYMGKLWAEREGGANS